MGWMKTANVAQYEQGNWDNFISKQSNMTPASAMRFAFADPNVTFFFFCREYMVLDGAPARYSPFQPGDAVFFSGEPWFGSAPQCDAYRKNGVSVGYINPQSNAQFQDIANYVLPDGLPAIDVACIFGANYCTDAIPCLRAQNNNPPTTDPFNANIESVLSAGLVQTLQAKGITVLLTILNGHASLGWSEFTDENVAQNFANYLKTSVVDPYRLDGIDIDDEYSNGMPNDQSLPMVTTLMKELVPNNMITKALWSDYSVFQSNWKGRMLASNLTYGWEMSYNGGGPNSRLSPYLQWGLNKNQLCLGFSAEQRFASYWGTIKGEAKDTITQGYAGGMMFAFENQPSSLTCMADMVDGMDGPG